MTCCISCGRAFTAPRIVRDGVTVHAAEVCGDCFHGWPAHEQRAVPGAGFVVLMFLIVGFVVGVCFGRYMTWPVN